MPSSMHICSSSAPRYFFLNAPAPPDLYTLSLHDALPISPVARRATALAAGIHVPQAAQRTSFSDDARVVGEARALRRLDRKSTRLNSSHANISYAVFCLQKKQAI